MFGNRNAGGGDPQLYPQNPGIPQVMSPTPGQVVPAQRTPRDRGSFSAGPGGSNTQTPIHQTWFMISDLMRLREGDEEETSQRIAFGEQQVFEANLRQENLRHEFEHAARDLRAELTIQAEQAMNYYVQEEHAYFQARTRTLQAEAETAVSAQQRNMQQQFLLQTAEVQQRAEAAERTANLMAEEHHQNLRNLSTECEQEMEQLRRELLDAQQAHGMMTESRTIAQQTLLRERAVHEQNLQHQEERWSEHSQGILEEAQIRIADYREAEEQDQEEITTLRAYLHEAQEELSEWEEWYHLEEHQEQWDTPGAGEEEEEAAAATVQPQTPGFPPATPPVLQGRVPAQFLPPTTLPSLFPARRQPTPSQTQQQQQQQQQQQASKCRWWTQRFSTDVGANDADDSNNASDATSSTRTRLA